MAESSEEASSIRDWIIISMSEWVGSYRNGC
jgi:hypothetical protein